MCDARSVPLEGDRRAWTSRSRWTPARIGRIDGVEALEGIRLVGLSIGLACIAGCSADAPEASGDLVVRTDSVGVEIVTSNGPSEGIEGARLLVPSLSIGLLDGPAELQLYAVTGAARLSDGRILIANSGSHELRWFDPEGAHLRSAGGEGDGPGEFRGLSALAIMRGDTALAWDQRTRRVSVFGPDGTFVRGFGLRAGDGEFPAFTDVFEDGRVLGRVGRLISEPPPDLSVVGSDVTHRLFTRDGVATDTIGTLPAGRAILRTIDQGGLVFFDIPFWPETRIAAGRALVIEGTGETFEIRVRGQDGAVRRLLRRSFEPISVTAELLERHFESEWADSERDRFRDLARGAYDAMPPIPHVPAFDALLVAADGAIWARAPALPGDETHTWSIFGVDGAWVRDAITPAGLTPHDAGDRWILGRMRDELDVELVVLFELEGEGPA